MKRVLILALLALIVSACEREKRDFSGPPVAEQGFRVALSPLSPGNNEPVKDTGDYGKQFESNAYHLSQGKQLFGQFNCSGCHGNGGGGSGPALMDAQWIYGGNIENIVATIREGRPNGMPSFRGRIPDRQIWQLAAYVRSLSGNVPKDAAPSRNDDLNPHPAENRLETLPPVAGGTIPPASTAPQ
jgi:cytochrome c oxidase cbb3-type subunit 3